MVQGIMEPFVESYGLSFPEFQVILANTNSLVAGSAALALYLQEYGIDPGFVPGDLDIWTEDNVTLMSSDGSKIRPSNMDRISIFLIQQGYNLTTKFEVQPDEDYEHLHYIKHILSFVNRAGKEVQLIVVNQSDLLTYITYYFDLSVCVSWWDAQKNTMETMYPETTIKKIMHVHPSLKQGEREEARIQKYKERGFYLWEHIPALDIRDLRLDVDILQDTNAFDVIAYEDVNAAQFLRTSGYHILIQMGEQLHAFHRTMLSTYLQEHSAYLAGVGQIVDTPHKLSLPEDFLLILPYSDYSVFRLQLAYTHQNKSIYRVECFTLANWFIDVPNMIIEPSLLNHDEPVPPSSLPLYHPDVYWMDG